MNSKSSNDFRWSIRITGVADNMLRGRDPCGGCGFSIGIASKFQHQKDYIINYDTNAISFEPYSGYILKGKNLMKVADIQRSTIMKPANSGDEIHFRFQSKLKKLSISLVCSIF